MTHHDQQWRRHAACRGSDPAAWFPERGQPLVEGIDPHAVCASCPVLIDCLCWAISAGERHGIHGGAGGNTKRLLFRAWRMRTHGGYRGRFDGAGGACDCLWCREVTAHLQRLRHATARVESNGPQARHGYRSTYARGCRCSRCRFSVTVTGAAMRSEGADLPDWWDATYGPRHGYSTHRPTVARQLHQAKRDGASWLDEKGHAA